MPKKKTPLRAIRAFCLECCGDSPKEVELCTANERDIRAAREDGIPYEVCSLYGFRFGKKPRRGRIKVLRAIRKKCLECCCGSSHEVDLCTNPNCSLFEYRKGHNPKRRGILKGWQGKPKPDEKPSIQLRV